MNTYTPVIILGAPRSGTNMLRDVLTSLEGIGTWPCDEINYIWRHGNLGFPTDEIPVENATRPVIAYIRQQFDRIAQKQKAGVVIEKTCANCLRVPFVDRVMPDAKYIYIYRDGIDAAGSARLRWSAEMDIPYILRKARYVPLTDLPYYALRYLWTRIYRLFSKEKRLAFWGPKFTGMDQVLLNNTLNEICILQWQACVRQAEAGLANISGERIFRVRYEDFVRQPLPELKRLLEFLGVSANPHEVMKSVEDVSASSLGKGRQSLGSDEIHHLESFVAAELKSYGYH